MSDVKTKTNPQPTSQKAGATNPDQSTAISTVVDQSYFMTPVDSTGETSRQKTPFVGLFGSKTKGSAEELKAAGIEVNQFYLYDEAGPLKVKPFTYHLLKAARYFTDTDSDGNVIETKLTDPYKDDKQTPFREHLMGLVVVVHKSTMGDLILTPATWSARSGVCKAIGKARDLIKSGGAAFDQKAWAARSPAHAISANAKFPGGRFLVTAWGTEEDTVNKKNKFNLGHSSISVTSAEGVAAFNKLVSEEFVSKIVPATQSWEWRCKKLEKLVK